MANRIKEMLKEGVVPVGTFIGLYSPGLAEMAGYCGFDFVVIDNEHGSFSWGEVEEMVRACEVAGVVPIVRVPSSNPVDILKALDRGAKGIHVPQINSQEEAEQVVAACKYPPLGNRGTAYSMRAAKYGTAGGRAHLERSNEDILIAVHIESPQAVEQVEGILGSGIDVGYIGPTDLSVSSGHYDGPSHPDVQALIGQVIAAGKKLGVAVGIQVNDGPSVAAAKEQGFKYVGVTSNPVILAAFRNVVSYK